MFFQVEDERCSCWRGCLDVVCLSPRSRVLLGNLVRGKVWEESTVVLEPVWWYLHVGSSKNIFVQNTCVWWYWGPDQSARSGVASLDFCRIFFPSCLLYVMMRGAPSSCLLHAQTWGEWGVYWSGCPRQNCYLLYCLVLYSSVIIQQCYIIRKLREWQQF